MNDSWDLFNLEFEEYDGLNDQIQAFLLVANLDMLMRGHSVKVKVDDWKVNILVPNLYKLNLNLPLEFDSSMSSAKFDCKKRQIYLFFPMKGLSLWQHSHSQLT